ncbi:VPLPA-CTERM sorting domain-containing protein [Sulfitobacter sp. D35]|uniref:VPLPA-CTERM sorting domain-containing protein n=1 Tax=Sulfitobacter sp. D35 TaxID=3083252 RepID=UPI00296F55BF|nr:VPLPA-CTERM sorting domain-containing protein [Sulfitobacter sp. D35]MDW4498704.1 VPLPA-CTERM sorting domain-containing protein [Sulfitobacter sp. D35]
MSLGKVIAAASFAVVVPFAASAAVVGGSFVEGGATNFLDANGPQGNANVATSDGDGMESFTWSFEATENLIVSGFGTVNFDFQFVNLSYMYNGNNIAVVPSVSNPGTSNVQFPELALMMGERFDVMISFDSASRGGDADFGLLTSQPAPVPVPAAGVLLLGGLAGFAGFKRRAKKKS